VLSESDIPAAPAAARIRDLYVNVSTPTQLGLHVNTHNRFSTNTHDR